MGGGGCVCLTGRHSQGHILPPQNGRQQLGHCLALCVWSAGLLAAESDLFPLLHDVLPVRARIGHLDPTRSDGHCTHCPGQQETIDHLFVSCPRVADIWLGVYFNLLAAFTTVLTNQELLRLAFTPCGCDNDVTATMASYVSLVWATRMSDRSPQWADLILALSDWPPPYRPLWAFRRPD